MIKQRIPFNDLSRNYASIADKVNESIQRVLKGGRFILDEEVNLFEKEFSHFSGSSFAIGVSSGTDAITLAIKSMDIGEGDEVITSANTAIPTLTGIIRAGAIPVMADVCEDDYTMDIGKIENAVSSKTKAIIPVHLYGYPCDMPSILNIAHSRGIKIIEDCAQAHGASIGGKMVGTFGNAGCFSFYPTKNLGAYGDGGMIITDSEEIAKKAKMLRHHGQSNKDSHKIRGFCARLDEIQAAILRVKLKFLAQWNRRRCDIAKKYENGLKPVKKPTESGERKSAWHLYVIRTVERTKLKEMLSQKGIETNIHYPKPAHLQEAFRDLGYQNGDFPKTEKLSEEILSLPIFPELKDDEVETIIYEVNTALS